MHDLELVTIQKGEQRRFGMNKPGASFLWNAGITLDADAFNDFAERTFPVSSEESALGAIIVDFDERIVFDRNGYRPADSMHFSEFLEIIESDGRHALFQSVMTHLAEGRLRLGRTEDITSSRIHHETAEVLGGDIEDVRKKTAKFIKTASRKGFREHRIFVWLSLPYGWTLLDEPR